MSVCDIKHKDRILEAIDQLRSRKARPDSHRICNYLMRRFGIDTVDAKLDLQKCVDKEIVLRVEYKGSTSYRNAAKKFSHLRRDGENLPVTNKPNRKFVALLTNAIAELIVHEPDYLEVGVPGPELIRNILSKDNVRYTKKYISILLEKEVESGGLVKMENGNYLVGPSPTKTEFSRESVPQTYVMTKPRVEHHHHQVAQMIYKKKEAARNKVDKFRLKKTKMVENGTSMDPKSYKANDFGILRVGSRRKRAKKVFDPSDNNIPKKRGRPLGSLSKHNLEKQLQVNTKDGDSRPESRSSLNGREQGGVCSVCHNNKKNSNERFVSCRECSNKAHVNCLNGDDMLLKMYPDNTWQCPHCKTCCVCFETSDAGDLVVCSVCADAYHHGCHEPPNIDITQSDKWLCINCQMPAQLQVAEIHPNVTSSDVFTHRESDTELQDKDPSSPGSSISDDSNENSPSPSPTPPTLSPQPSAMSKAHSPDLICNMSDSLQSYKELDLEELIDPSIPDAKDWTADEVYDYFFQYFPDEAIVFKEQEIDGSSLLLMKRMDVISSLKLKLGTALKIYRHVVKLQFRRDDPKLYWL